MHEHCCGNGLNNFMRRLKPSRKLERGFDAIVVLAILSFVAFPSLPAQAATSPTSGHPAATSAEAETAALTEGLGIHFVPGSSSTLLLERDGKTYLIDVAGQTIREKESPPSQPVAPEATLVAAHSSPSSAPVGARIFAENCARCHGAGGQGGGAEKTPDLTKPETQAVLSDARAGKIIRDGKPGTSMPAWRGRLSEDEINSVASFVKTLGPGSNPNLGRSPARAERIAKAYVPADDYLFSMPTGRKLDRHGFYFNFTIDLLAARPSVGPAGATLWPALTISRYRHLDCATELPISSRLVSIGRPA
jgi:mono/diheme cytochrome c family protein